MTLLSPEVERTTHHHHCELCDAPVRHHLLASEPVVVRHENLCPPCWNYGNRIPIIEPLEPCYCPDLRAAIVDFWH